MKGLFEVATFNICGVLKHQEKSCLLLRLQWFEQFIKANDIDFFALQEVSFEVWKCLENISRSSSYKLYPEEYDWENHDDDHVIVCFLSKVKALHYHLEFFPHHTKNLDYSFLSIRFADFHLINIHLNAGAENSNLRQKQLEYLRDRVIGKSDESNIIILGDFNSDLNDKNQKIIGFLGEDWVDCWKKVGDSDGYTQNPEKNYLRKLFGHSKGKRRVDAIIFHEDNYLIPEEISLFAEDPVEKKIYPSDHYGVRCSFKLSWKR